MLQNTTITAFTVSELLRENQQRGTIIPPPPPRLGLKEQVSVINKQKYSFKNTSSYETRVSDHRHLIYSVMKTAFECEEPKN